MVRSFPWLAFVGLLLGGCSFDASVPAGATVACETTAQCPPGRTCHLQRCVLATDIDNVPPDLEGAPSISPAVGRSGTHFTIGLVTTEACCRRQSSPCASTRP